MCVYYNNKITKKNYGVMFNDQSKYYTMKLKRP